MAERPFVIMGCDDIYAVFVIQNRISSAEETIMVLDVLQQKRKRINTMVQTMFKRETTTFEPKQPPFEVVISPGLRKELRKRPPPPPSRPHAVIEQQPQPQRLPPLPPPPPPSRIEKRRF